MGECDMNRVHALVAHHLHKTLMGICSVNSNFFHYFPLYGGPLDYFPLILPFLPATQNFNTTDEV